MSLADLIIPVWVKPVVLAVVVAIAGIAVWRWHHGAIDDAVTAVRAEYTAKALEAANKAAQQSKDLQALAEQTQGEKDAQIKIQSDRIAVLSASLRQRAQRPSGAASDTAVAGNCTGARLYRDDAEFLSWFAAQAARVGAELTECQAQFNQVREKLK